MRLLLFFLICLIIKLTFAKKLDKKDSIGIVNISGKLYLRYLVTPGETIYGISTKYKVPITDLLELNPELENGLKVGQIITIPYEFQLNSSKSDDKSEYVYHVVEPGETFYSLSRKYGISVSDLLKLNDIELKVGQKVIVGKKSNIDKKDKHEPNHIKYTQEDMDENLSDSKVYKSKTSNQTTELKQNTIAENKTIIIKSESKPSEMESLVLTENDKKCRRILVIPFDPYLYFSDADDEIAAVSKIERTKVRQAFRKRLNALLEPEGYETIHLLGGKLKDSLTDLNRVYSSVTYSYEDILNNAEIAQNRVTMEKGMLKEADKSKSTKPSETTNPFKNSRASLSKDESKYFAVKIKDPNFFNYFNTKYNIDYYIFINQFEVKTNYENCLDRARQNYERSFITHFSIFDSSGKQIAGNRIKINYESNENRIQKILADNMQKVADKIIAELPKLN